MTLSNVGTYELYCYVKRQQEEAVNNAKEVMGKQDNASKLEHAKEAAKFYAFHVVLSRMEFLGLDKNPFDSALKSGNESRRTK